MDVQSLCRNFNARAQVLTHSVAYTVRGLSSNSRYGLISHENAYRFLATAYRGYASKSFPEHRVITMPALSPTMTQGNIGTWKKNLGDRLNAGDVLVEIETDKAQMDLESQDEGYLAQVLLESGTKDVAVGNPIAVIVESENDVAAFTDFSIGDAGRDSKVILDTKQTEELTQSPSKIFEEPKQATTISSQESRRIESENFQSAQIVLASGQKSAFIASPLARRLAVEQGVPLSNVKGTGPQGRITKDDVESYVATSGSTSTASPPEQAYTDYPLSGMRKIIAKRLSQSMYTAPHYYLHNTINVAKLLKLREALNKTASLKISINDLIVKAVATAIRRNPNVNVSYLESEGVLRQHNQIDISVAVATPNGLLTPVVKNVIAKGLEDISQEIKGLSDRARSGKLKPEEYTGGTFTVSNMGMLGIDEFTAIINPPQSCILAVGKVVDTVLPEQTADGGYKIEPIMKLVMSCDHRSVDGAVGGEYMKGLKQILENPLTLLL